MNFRRWEGFCASPGIARNVIKKVQKDVLSNSISQNNASLPKNYFVEHLMNFGVSHNKRVLLTPQVTNFSGTEG